LDKSAFVYGDIASTDVRAKLCQLLKEVSPGDLNGFFFASSGAEANEAAFNMARRFTGRPKIMSRYRSYHGGTPGTLTATGDPRTWGAD
jgi:taurine--2-oxoglutarate transaminase